MVEQLWLFVWLSALLVALIAGVSVLMSIVREAATRNPAEHRPPDERVKETLAGSDNRCPNCENVVDPAFEYCGECATKRS